MHHSTQVFHGDFLKHAGRAYHAGKEARGWGVSEVLQTSPVPVWAMLPSSTAIWAMTAAVMALRLLPPEFSSPIRSDGALTDMRAAAWGTRFWSAELSSRAAPSSSVSMMCRVPRCAAEVPADKGKCSALSLLQTLHVACVDRDTSWSVFLSAKTTRCSRVGAEGI